MTILVVTNREDFTADFVVLELRRRGLAFVRLNTEDIPTRAKICWYLGTDNECAYLDVLDQHIDLEQIKSIWYRRPVPPKPSEVILDEVARQFAVRESAAALGGVLRSLDCLWVSHPDALHAASYKIRQLSLAKKLGFKIPDTLITDITSEAERFLSSTTSTVYKPIFSGRLRYSERDRLIFTSEIRDGQSGISRDVELAPCQFQQRIEKKVDIRVTVIGQILFAVSIASQETIETQLDWRRGDAFDLEHTIIELPGEIEARCKALVSELGLEFGAIDLVLSPDDEYYFLEINPNGQWVWIEQITGLPLVATLVDLLAGKKT